MKSRVVVLFVGLAVVVLSFNAGYVFGQSPAAPYRVFPASFPNDENSEAFAPFWEVVNMVETSFYDQPVDRAKLVEGAINGLLESLDDPH
ncbi:MAG: hypothetical protein ACK2UK_12080, partial [Candidatus Promineifilaceae bacterium]